MRARRLIGLLGVAALGAAGFAVTTSAPAGAIVVSDEANLRAEFQDPIQTEITLGNDITLTDCAAADLDRGFIPGTQPLVLDGAGFTITQTCPERVINFEGNDLTLRNVTITGGDENGGGGGISVDDDGNPDLIIENSTITGNQADAGGGIDSTDTTGNVTITDSTISNNIAASGGGGISGGEGLITINRSTISGNEAGGDGGGINTGPFPTGSLAITNSTITLNTALGVGGGFNTNNALVHYSTITNNSAPGGANIFGDTPIFTFFGTIVTQGQGGGANCEFNSPPTSTSSGYNFSDSDTCVFNDATDTNDGGDPELGDLGNNDGPTATQLPADGSPVIDQIPAASPCAGVNIVVDQRGEPRPVVAGEFCDIGAVEVQPVVGPVVAVAVTPTFTG